MISETEARQYLESILWPNGPVCPHCNSVGAFKLTPRPTSKSPVRTGVYKCKTCRKQFTVTVGTIFVDSKAGIAKWIDGLRIVYEYDKITIADFQIVLGLSYKSAWLMLNKIRFHKGNGIEVDEWMRRIALSW